MSESETSEDEAADIDECVSVAYKKFADGSFVAETENSENPLLSPSTSAPSSSQCDSSPQRSSSANKSWLVDV